MNLKILHQVSIMTRYAFIGMVIQVVCYTVLWANNGNAQKKSLEDIYLSVVAENTSIEAVFFLIEGKTSFTFAYAEGIIQNKGISIRAENQSIANILRQISQKTDLHFKRVNQTIHASKRRLFRTKNKREIEEVFFDDITVSGQITGSDSSPLPGASVVVKGTTTGTITDANGEFSLTAPEEGTLVVTFIGYATQEISINSRSVINVVLVPDVTELQELVVVGYGEQKKANVTSSLVNIGEAEIKQSPVANLSNALVGRLPGLIAVQRSGAPGADGSNLLVRGVGTLGNAEPLVIVDGVQREFSQFDPHEIADITILKDAAAAAVYGVRGANGVILITTKRGQVGKPTITYSGEFSVQKAVRLPNFLGSEDYANLLNEAMINEGGTAFYSDEDIQRFGDGSSPNTHPDTDWFDEALRPTAPQWHHNLSVDGGSEKATYFLSVGYLKQEGLLRGTNQQFQRYNFRSNIDLKITEELTVSLDLSGRQEDRDNPSVENGSIFSQLVRNAPTIPAFFDNGLAAGFRGGNSIARFQDGGFSDDRRKIFQGRLKGVYELPFVEGLSLQGWAAVDRIDQKIKTWNTPYEFFNLVNGNFESAISGNDPQLTEIRYEGRLRFGSADPNLTLNGSINFGRTIGDHDVSALLAVEKATHESETLNAFRRGFLSNKVPSLFAGDAETSSNGGGSLETGRLGYLGRVTYAYRGKYLFEASFRRDASENFPKDERWGFFPAFSAGWRITEEPFMGALEIIDELKLRASWGRLGNDRIARFQFLDAFAFGDAYVFGGASPAAVATLTPGVAANPDVTWETATTTNLGMDLGLLESKLTLEADYFFKKTKDILIASTLEVPSYSGLAGLLPSENIGEVETKGFELSLGYQDRIGKVSYWAKGNYSFTKDEVTFIAEPEEVEDNLKRTGRPVQSLFGLKAIGLFQSQEEIDNHADQQVPNLAPGDIKYEDINNDDVIDDQDRVFLGTINLNNAGQAAPQVIYGLSFGAEYNGFDLSVLFQGADKFNVYLSEEAAWAFFNGGKVMNIHLDRWTPDNPNASYPRILTQDSNNRRVSSYWLRDASYLRLKNLEIGYTLPDALLSRVGLQKVRFHIAGLNLLTFSEIENFDPEVPTGRGWSYPQQKVFTFGLTATL